MSEFTAEDLADLHNHFVPGVDDGSASVEESVLWLESLHAEGVRRLATTPHFAGRLATSPDEMRARLDEIEAGFGPLAEACEGRDDLPEIRLSQEILVEDAAWVEPLLSDPRIGIPGTRYLLAELGWWIEEDRRPVIRAFLDAGRTPIAVHPERLRRPEGRLRFAEIRSWKEAGAVLQVNGGSLLGIYGETVERRAWRMLSEGLADLVASDHHGDGQPVSPAEVGRAIAERGGAEQARLLLSENPNRVLDDRELVQVGALI